MDKIERLRALERYCLEQAEMMAPMIKSGAVDEGYGIGAGNAYKVCAQRIATLIAELGQEVGAVAWEWRWIGDATEDPGPWNLCDNEGHAMLIANTSGYEVRHRPPSPAHTSEARDAEVAELIEATRRLTADIEFRIDDPRSQLLDRARRATTAAVGCNCPGSAKVSYLSHAPNCPAREALGKFAAMRQEGGTP